MFKNYYQILDLSPDATKEEVRKAYKLFASKFHPDKNGNDPFFNARFLEVQEAYEVLSDDDKRKEYDEQYFQKEELDLSSDPSVRLIVSKNSIKFGKTVKFVWETENITSLEIVGHGLYPVNGFAEFTPIKNTEYVFLFSNDKDTIKKSVIIEVKKYEDIWLYIIAVIIATILFVII